MSWCLGGSTPLSIADFGLKSRRGPCAHALAGGLGSPRSQGKARSARPLRLPLFPWRSWGLGVRPHFPVSAPPSGKCVLGLAAAPPSVVLGRSSKSADPHHHELRECPARSSLLSPVPCFLSFLRVLRASVRTRISSCLGALVSWWFNPPLDCGMRIELTARPAVAPYRPGITGKDARGTLCCARNKRFRRMQAGLEARAPRERRAPRGPCACLSSLCVLGVLA